MHHINNIILTAFSAVVFQACAEPPMDHVDPSSSSSGIVDLPSQSSSASSSSTSSSSSGGIERCVSSCPVDVYPLGDRAECWYADASCNLIPFPEGEPCHGGVGYCRLGECIKTTCQAKLPTNQGNACFTDLDCPTDNPCLIGDCPEPGCSPCHYAERPDTDTFVCPDGVSKCAQGACCDSK